MQLSSKSWILAISSSYCKLRQVAAVFQLLQKIPECPKIISCYTNVLGHLLRICEKNSYMQQSFLGQHLLICRKMVMPKSYSVAVKHSRCNRRFIRCKIKAQMVAATVQKYLNLVQKCCLRPRIYEHNLRQNHVFQQFHKVATYFGKLLHSISVAARDCWMLIINEKNY